LGITYVTKHTQLNNHIEHIPDSAPKAKTILGVNGWGNLSMSNLMAKNFMVIFLWKLQIWKLIQVRKVLPTISVQSKRSDRLVAIVMTCKDEIQEAIFFLNKFNW